MDWAKFKCPKCGRSQIQPANAKYVADNHNGTLYELKKVEDGLDANGQRKNR